MATLATQSEVTGTQNDVTTSEGGASLESRIEIARRDLISQVHAITEQAKAVVPGATDELDRRALQLETALNAVRDRSFSSEADVEQLIGSANQLAQDAVAQAELRGNPWRIKVWRPEAGAGGDRFHDVMRVRVPRNHAIEIRQDGQHGSSVHQIRQGNFRDKPLGEGAQYWRESDPSDPNYDIITIATKNQREVSVDCRTEVRGAFEGQMRIRDLCTCESQTVNINNGRENRFGTSREGPLSVSVSTEALVEPPKDIEIAPAPLRPDEVEEALEAPTRPPQEPPLEFSPSDNYEAAGYASSREYLAAMNQAAQLPPRHSVALVGAGLKVTLKSEHSEMLSLSQNALGTTATFLPSAYSEAELNAPDGILIGVNVARIRRDPDDTSGQTFIIEPGGRHNSDPYSVSITRIGNINGDGRVADSILYLGEETVAQTARPPQETLEEQSARTPPPVESRTVSSLPEPGAVVTETDGVKITLNDTSLSTLMVYHNGSNIGTFQSNSRENEYRFGPHTPLVLKRELSPRAAPNTFMLYAGDDPVEGRYDLWIRPFESGEPIHTHVEVYAAANKPQTVTEPQPAVELSQLETQSVGEPADVIENSLPQQLAEAPRQTQIEPNAREEVEITPPKEAEETVEETSTSPQIWEVGARTITVARGEVATFEYQYEVSIPGGKEQRRSGEPYVFRGDTVGASIPNVGKISRKTLPDGSQEITFTPAPGFNGQTSLQPIPQPSVATNPQPSQKTERGQQARVIASLHTAA